MPLNGDVFEPEHFRVPRDVFQWRKPVQGHRVTLPVPLPLTRNVEVEGLEAGRYLQGREQVDVFELLDAEDVRKVSQLSTPQVA